MICCAVICLGYYQFREFFPPARDHLWVSPQIHSFGRYVYAIGGNEQAARVAGVRVDAVKIIVYALSGALSALAGILYAVQYRQGKPEAGAGAELDAIAAVVIGRNSLVGGKGSMVGTLVGVLIFGFLGNILVLKNIDSSLQLVLRGFLLNSSNGNLYYAYAKEA